MNNKHESERVQTVVIGGGQAGLSVGYHLAKRDLPFVILDANPRIGDAWRNRWDSLRLFTPARFDGLDGMPFPAPPDSFPTKDQMADYLEAYAADFQLPVRSGVTVDRLTREGDWFVVWAGERRFEAQNVVVAMSSYQKPRIPAFAQELDPALVQLHSSEYRGPSQLAEGGVLIVGSGNSGAEIAVEVVRTHPTWVSGKDTGSIPFSFDGVSGRLLLRPFFRGLFHRLLTVDNPVGRRAYAKMHTRPVPLIRVKPKHMVAAGIERVERTVGVRDGLPLLADGRVLNVANVIWCTGFHPNFSWIDLPVLGEHGPVHQSGIVPHQAGLYFVGLHFLYSASSAMVHGVGRDAERIVRSIAARTATAPAALRSIPTPRPARLAS
jgi:putative flavoprotein involved in K+ transport